MIGVSVPQHRDPDLFVEGGSSRSLGSPLSLCADEKLSLQAIPQICVRREINFCAHENLFSCGRKNIFLRKKIWPSAGHSLFDWFLVICGKSFRGPF